MVTLADPDRRTETPAPARTRTGAGIPGATALIEEVQVEDPARRGRRTRRDALPEHTRYADTGCDLHPSCLSCPLVRCRYDEPGGLPAAVKRGRDDAILSARRVEKMSIRAIARRFGISRRTVFRVLARAREGGASRW